MMMNMYNRNMDKKIIEWRRMRAWELKQEGWKQIDIAKSLKVTKSSVSQWIKRGREGGVEALKTPPPRQYKHKLSDEQIRQLIEDLKKGAEAFGYKGNIWTGKRISELIMREFGIFYHWHSMARLMRQIGWSSQKPIQRANQRNEEAIKEWANDKWKEIKKIRTRRIKDFLDRRSWILSVAYGDEHICSYKRDTDFESKTYKRSSIIDKRFRNGTG